MPQQITPRTESTKPSARQIDRYDWAGRADEALELARSLPPGHERNAALKQAGLLRRDADKRGLIKRGRPAK